MPTAPTTHVYKTVGSCRIHADLYRLPSSPAPVLVAIHGGALIMGHRKWIPAAQVERYLSRGYAVVSIDYRLAPETKLPSIIDDVSDAFKWLVSNARAFGVDTNRLGVFGHSAGGYLTLMTGFCVSPRPRALVSFYGYGDIVGDWYARPDPFYCTQPAVTLEKARLVVGTECVTAPENDRDPFYLYCRQHGLWPKEVAGLDPVANRDAFTPFCPLQNVSPAYPPTMLLHGDRDTDVPYEQSVMMHEALDSAGVENELITIPGGEHGFDKRLDDPVVADALERAADFFDRHLTA